MIILDVPHERNQGIGRNQLAPFEASILRFLLYLADIVHHLGVDRGLLVVLQLDLQVVLVAHVEDVHQLHVDGICVERTTHELLTHYYSLDRCDVRGWSKLQRTEVRQPGHAGRDAG